MAVDVTQPGHGHPGVGQAIREFGQLPLVVVVGLASPVVRPHDLNGEPSAGDQIETGRQEDVEALLDTGPPHETDHRRTGRLAGRRTETLEVNPR